MGIDRPLTFGPDLMKKLKEISLDKEVLEKTEGKYKYINGINEEYIRDLTKTVKIKRNQRKMVRNLYNGRIMANTFPGPMKIWLKRKSYVLTNSIK
jgi:phosphomannomutase